MPSEQSYTLTVDELAQALNRDHDSVLTDLDAESLVRLPSGKWGLSPGRVRDYLAGIGARYPFQVIANINLKGGTGKTTTTISAATRATQYGYRACVVDLDAQANATLAFDRVPDEDDPVFCDIWQHPKDMVMGTIRPVSEFLYILPSSLENSLLDVSLVNPGFQKKAVRGVCDVLRENGFELVLIDCPPSLGTAVISAICAADTIVIPVCCDEFSLKGLEFTLKETDSICDAFQLDKPDIHILFTQVDKRLNISDTAIQTISSRYPEYLIPFPIRVCSLFSKLLAKKKTVFALTGSNRAKSDYDRCVRYILQLDHLSATGG